MKTILITGINGFLGSSIAKALSHKYNIIGIEYSLDNLFRIANCNYKIYSTKDDIPDSIFTEQTIDIIIHTATFYGKDHENPLFMYNSNLNSPFILLNKAILHGCQLFINTDTVLDRHVNTYSLTKHQFREWLFLRKNEIKVINMQLEHFYGNGASNTNFITNMINRLKNNEPQIDLTKGEQQRDFIYIDDVVNAYLIIVKKQNLVSSTFTTFQVCNNQLISIKELLIQLKELTKSNTKLNFGAIQYRENEMMFSTTNNSTLRNLGWNPIYTLNEGLKLTCS
jgi:nucleoside-diphosphate-sugar epimerase